MQSTRTVPLNRPGRVAAVLMVAVLSGTLWLAGQEAPALAPPPDSSGAGDRSFPTAPAELPGAPESRVFDRSGVFTPEQETALASLLTTAASERGLDVYVATYTFIEGETIERRAERLKNAWCRSEFGLVLVFDRGSGNLTFSARVPEAMPVTATEIEGLFREANEASRAAESTGGKLMVLMESLVPKLGEKLALHRKLKSDRVSQEQWLLLAATGAIVIGGLAIAIFVRRARRKRQALRPATVYFPTVVVGERFGAPFGGGSIAELDFGSPPPPGGRA